MLFQMFCRAYSYNSIKCKLIVDKKNYKQTDRLNRETNRQTDKWKNKKKNIKVGNIQTNKQKEKNRDRQPNL